MTVTKEELEELKRLEQLLLIDLRAAYKMKRRLHEMFDGRAMLQGIVYNASRDCVDFECGAINDLNDGENLEWLHGADALIKFMLFKNSN